MTRSGRARTSPPSTCRRRREMTTDWGRLPVVAVEDLVRLKRTRRPADYDVISNLVAIHLQAEDDDPPGSRLRWALENTYRLEDVLLWREELPGVQRLLEKSQRACLSALSAGNMFFYHEEGNPAARRAPDGEHDARVAGRRRRPQPPGSALGALGRYVRR